MAASTRGVTNSGEVTTGSPEPGPTPSLAEASALREPPATARGIRTRNGLVAAARQVFERDGFLESRLADITAAANCSIGTFYTYFDSKEEIFHAVLESAADDMLHPGFGMHFDLESSPYAVIAASNRAYLEAYQRNAKLMMLLEQVATIDRGVRDARQRRSRAFIERNARGIARMQQSGWADATLDPYQTALALSAMVSFTAYYTYCLEDNPISADQLAEQLTTLWANALRLTPPSDRPRP